MSAKLLFFAGSAREQSYNKKLARAACAMASEMGASATFLDLRDYPMPIYEGDWEDKNGLPEAAIQLKQIFIDHDGLFIASPEHNSAFSSLLKNSLDWITRAHLVNEPSLSAYQNKVAAIASASPGSLGGLRGLVSLRMLLGNIAVTVVPNQLALRQAHKAFDEHGNLIDATNITALSGVVSRLIESAQPQKK